MLLYSRRDWGPFPARQKSLRSRCSLMERRETTDERERSSSSLPSWSVCLRRAMPRSSLRQVRSVHACAHACFGVGVQDRKEQINAKHKYIYINARCRNYYFTFRIALFHRLRCLGSRLACHHLEAHTRTLSPQNSQRPAGNAHGIVIGGLTTR